MSENKSNSNSNPDPHGSNDSMMSMMALMMGVCFGGLLLFTILPAAGLPLGILIAVGAGGLMMFLHNRFMGHRSGH